MDSGQCLPLPLPLPLLQCVPLVRTAAAASAASAAHQTMAAAAIVVVAMRGKHEMQRHITTATYGGLNGF